MEREYARHAVRLIKREPPKGFKKLQCTDSEIVHYATELALDLQKGKMWVRFKLKINYKLFFLIAEKDDSS